MCLIAHRVLVRCCELLNIFKYVFVRPSHKPSMHRTKMTIHLWQKAPPNSAIGHVPNSFTKLSKLCFILHMYSWDTFKKFIYFFPSALIYVILFHGSFSFAVFSVFCLTGRYYHFFIRFIRSNFVHTV